MKRIVTAVSLAATLIALSGCSSADPHQMTLEACEKKIKDSLNADSYDLSGLVVVNLSEALAESDIPDPDNESEGMVTVYGDIEADRETYSTICTAEFIDGEVRVMGSHPYVVKN